MTNVETEAKDGEQEQPRELDLIINVDEVNNSDPFVENQTVKEKFEQENAKDKVIGSLEL